MKIAISIHKRLEDFFYKLTKGLIPVVAVLLGVSSWVYPLVAIWIDWLDKELSFLKIILYISAGICFFYIGLALGKISKSLNQKESA